MNVADLGTILTVWAHPDDETFTAAGIMAQAAANGQKVIVVTATKGERGVQDESRWPQAGLGDTRAAELRAALDILGVKTQHWLGYADGGCADVPVAEAAAKIRAYLEQYRPDTILTFGPDGLTGHPDHRAVSAWVSQAAGEVPVYHAVLPGRAYAKLRAADEAFNLFYNIDRPPLVDEVDCDLLLKLPEDLLDKKYRCFCAMPSQYDALVNKFDRDTLCGMFGSEAFIKAIPDGL